MNYHSSAIHRRHHARRCNKAQCAKISFVIAILLILIIPYIVFDYVLDSLTFKWIYAIIWILLIVSYLNASFISPGLVKKGWYKNYPSMHQILKQSYKNQNYQMDSKYNADNKDNKDSETQSLLSDYDTDELPEYFAQPPRSHYCPQLNAYVLRMDNFCVFLNNAIGFYNYKYFILTLFYLCLICLLTIFNIIYYFCTDNKTMSWLDYSLYYIIFCLISIIVSFIFLIFSSMNLFLNYFKITKNLTTIEYINYRQVERICKHYKINFCHTHEYDHGVFDNINRMIGSNIFCWFIPIAPKLKDDPYKYDINKINKQKINALYQEIELKKQEMANNTVQHVAVANVNTSQ